MNKIQNFCPACNKTTELDKLPEGYDTVKFFAYICKEGHPINYLRNGSKYL